MDATPSTQRPSRALLIFGGILVGGVAIYVGTGMPGMDHGDAMSNMTHVAASLPPRVANGQSKIQVLDPARFAIRAGTTAVLLNVHVPFEGEIEGTSLSIPFDKIAIRAAELPTNLDTPLLVYCRSGRMSAIASAELVQLGYRNVSELDGGMLAWEQSGRSLIRTDPRQPVK